MRDGNGSEARACACTVAQRSHVQPDSTEERHAQKQYGAGARVEKKSESESGKEEREGEWESEWKSRARA